ncbi:hypothetical protein [Rhodanobacter sp. FW106-PBR-LB-2-11]|uniref:hypothetical protein n=1 Tax=Rhodanobacter sp. FW106-PBR-LB-2-11 TaxID=1524463 RepID=UPI0034E42F49
MTAGAAHVPGGRAWLDDGDTISSLWHLLTPEQTTPDGWLPTLMVGRCGECHERYYAFFVKMTCADFAEVDDYLFDNIDVGEDSYSLCELVAPQNGLPPIWLLKETQTQTQAGVLHEHIFGPFTLTDARGVIGSHGVSSCGGAQAEPWQHAARVLASLWNAMRTHNRERNGVVGTLAQSAI